MAVTTEIAPNLYLISVFAPWGNLQFNHFLVKDGRTAVVSHRPATNA